MALKYARYTLYVNWIVSKDWKLWVSCSCQLFVLKCELEWHFSTVKNHLCIENVHWQWYKKVFITCYSCGMCKKNKYMCCNQKQATAVVIDIKL